MSSRFVSAGAIDPSTGEATTTTTAPTDSTSPSTTTAQTAKQLAWTRAAAELEAARLARAAAASNPAPEKSLYETLQANKAAKQAAFDEAHRLRNQFRALDDDEVDFLEAVRERKRREEEEGRREEE
ncbi:N-terminal domain of NEFA-interacting nuclear protein NIP30-domain-containing protein, partial [Staphylotrichum tortipilum]